MTIVFCLAVAGCTDTASVLDAGMPRDSTPGETSYRDLQIVDRLPPPQNTNQGQDQPIAENDLLEIDVFQVKDLDRTVRVDPRGRINLALIGEIDAAGNTIPQLEKEIEKRYGAKYLQNPDVSVFMKESAGQRVTVDGQINKPGIYQVSSGSTLLQTIAQAGGFQEIADETKVYVYRQFGDKKLVANYNVKAIREAKKPDPRIFGGDVIVSFTSDAKVAARNLREALGMAGRAAVLAPLL